MRLSLPPTTLIALSGTAIAVLTADDLVKNINILTIKSQNLIAPADSLTLSNAVYYLIGKGPWADVIKGFTDIIKTVDADIKYMNSEKPVEKFTGDGASEIADAFRNFVEVHQQLLGVMIGKAGFLTQIPFVGPPVCAVLRLLENVVDNIANGIINTVDDATAAVFKDGLGALGKTIDGAIDGFDIFGEGS